MRLKTRWLLVSLGVGVDMPGSAVTVGKVVLWPQRRL